MPETKVSTIVDEKTSDKVNDDGAVAYLKKFTGDTSVHGVKYSFDYSRSRGIRIVWILLCMTAIGSVLSTLYQLRVDYLQYPTQTVVSIRPVDELPFPAITICNINGIELSKLKAQDTPTNNVSAAFSNFFILTSALRDYSAFARNSSENLLTPEYFDKAFQDIVQPTFADLDSTLLYCSYDGIREDCSSMFRPLELSERRCFQFNNQQGDGRRVSRISGYGSGLQVIFNVRQQEYMFSPTMSAGARIILHEPYEMPDLDSGGFLAGPGNNVISRTVKRKMIYLPEPFKAFGGKACVPEADFTMPYSTITDEMNLTYTYSLCRRICVDNLTQQRCGCRRTNASFTYNRTLPLCSLEEVWACYYYFFVYLSKWTPESACPCPRLCQYTSYRESVSSAYFPSDSATNTLYELNVTEDKDFRKNYFELNVFYDELVIDEMSRVPVHTSSSILGNVGGQMGLFLGASLLSVMELVQLVCGLCYRAGRALFCRQKK